MRGFDMHHACRFSPACSMRVVELKLGLRQIR